MNVSSPCSTTAVKSRQYSLENNDKDAVKKNPADSRIKKHLVHGAGQSGMTRQLASFLISHQVKLPECIKEDIEELTRSVRDLQINKLITDSMATGLFSYIETISCVHQGLIPEKINRPSIFMNTSMLDQLPSEILLNNDLLEECIKESEQLMQDPATKILIRADTVLQKSGVACIVSKEYATDLYGCISLLSKNIIEIGCGRAMLTAALSEVEDSGERLLLATDIEPQKALWKSDICFKRISAEKVTAHPKYKHAYMNIIYIGISLPCEIIFSLIDQGNPLFLVLIGPQLPIQQAKIDNKQLKMVELAIHGDEKFSFASHATCLLGINMPEGDFQKKIAMIPEKYRKSS